MEKKLLLLANLSAGWETGYKNRIELEATTGQTHKLANVCWDVSGGGQSKIYCENMHMGAEKKESTGPQSVDGWLLDSCLKGLYSLAKY